MSVASQAIRARAKARQDTRYASSKRKDASVSHRRLLARIEKEKRLNQKPKS